MGVAIASVGALLVAVNLILAGSEPEFEIKPLKQEDAVTASKDGKTFTAKVKSGIGGAAIQLTSGDWPKEVVFRFEYAAAKPFNSLEGFTLTTDKFRIEGSLKESGKMSYAEKNDEGKFVSKGTVNVVAKPNQNGIDVILPAGQLAGVKRVEIRWVDYYR